MPLYPTVEDIIEANKVALKKGRDKHPHKLVVKREALQNILNQVKNEEKRGLEYQTALLMRWLSVFQPFSGANHRTGFYVGELFLRLNGLTIQVMDGALYEFY